MKQIVNE